MPFGMGQRSIVLIAFRAFFFNQQAAVPESSCTKHGLMRYVETNAVAVAVLSHLEAFCTEWQEREGEKACLEPLNYQRALSCSPLF